MPRLIYFILVSCIAVSCFGQNNVLPVFKDSTLGFTGYLESALNTAFQNDTSLTSVTGVGFVRFKIDVTGNMVNIECSAKMQPQLKLMLSKLFSSASRLWYPYIENGKKLQSAFIVVPVVVANNSYPLDKTIAAVDFFEYFSFEGINKQAGGQTIKFDPNVRFRQENVQPAVQMNLPPVFYYHRNPNGKWDKKFNNKE